MPSSSISRFESLSQQGSFAIIGREEMDAIHVHEDGQRLPRLEPSEGLELRNQVRVRWSR
jgi:hypothetical protein